MRKCVFWANLYNIQLRKKFNRSDRYTERGTERERERFSMSEEKSKMSRLKQFLSKQTKLSFKNEVELKLLNKK